MDPSKLLSGFRVYPALRDHSFKTGAQWLKGRRMDDQLDGLWRVHDKLYNLSSFISHHPGGPDWIELTRGTDITEVFESSHLNPAVLSLLGKFYVKPAGSERISPFTFHPDGFYSTLKRRAYQLLSSVPAEKKLRARKQVGLILDILLTSFVFSLLLAGLVESYWAAILSGLLLFLVANSAHNFAHQRDNWRMYSRDLSFVSTFDLRVTHSLSHHPYANSVLDFDLSGFEPMFDFRVYRKSSVQRFLVPFTLFNVIAPNFFILAAFKRILSILLGHIKLRPEYLLPLSTLAVLFLLGSGNPVRLWLVMHVTFSYVYALVNIAAGHHHPDLYHPGDGPFQLGNDWGLAQLDAVGDRRDVDGNLVTELTMYGQHTLHHMFPTLDHGLLAFLRPVFDETCKDFGLPDEVYKTPSKLSHLDFFLGAFRQAARILPRPSKFNQAGR